MSKSGKGSAFERAFCKRLSLWWTQDTLSPRDDVFWRTQNSGGRSTSRSKQGKTTRGQYGDIAATDPIGQPLLDLLSFELKRGYSKFTIADLLDKPERAKEQLYEGWINKIIKTSKQAETPYWALVVQRNRRDALLIAPYDFFVEIRACSVISGTLCDTYNFGWDGIGICKLNDFLASNRRTDIKQALIKKRA